MPSVTEVLGNEIAGVTTSLKFSTSAGVKFAFGGTGLTKADKSVLVIDTAVPAYTSIASVANDVPGFGMVGYQHSGQNNLGIAGYSEAHIAGTLTGHTYGSGAWVNIESGAVTGGFILAAQDNGIYDAGGTLTNTTVVYGMRMEAILASAPAALYPFELNNNNMAITGIFHLDGTAQDISFVASSQAMGTKSGSVCLFVDHAGVSYYVPTYAARS